MKFSKKIALALCATLFTVGVASAKPVSYLRGTIQYDPAKTYNSYIIISTRGTAKLIDRNGNLVHEWETFEANPQPNRLYQGGYLLTSLYPMLKGNDYFQDRISVALLDWDGNVVREFTRLEKTDKPTMKQHKPEADGSYWLSRQHHDYQLEGDPVGYFSSVANVKKDGKMMVLSHCNAMNPAISDKQLLDDIIVIVDKDQNILWQWKASDHFEDLGFNEEGRAALKARKISGKMPHGGVDWLHINCVSWLGPNKWYDAGDERFHPDNIICDGRESSHIFIIDHKTGKIVWKVTPPFIGEDAKLGPLSGIHSTHMIPKGLPGEGNILLFDNGGTGVTDLYNSQAHAYSRIVEFDPLSKKIVWEYSPLKMIKDINQADNFFFSSYISSVQRLPNGNTLICEGSSSRIFEVSPYGDIVWEYINPYTQGFYNTTYRAYAVPYDYIPQLKKPTETAVKPPKFLEPIILPDVNGNYPKMLPKLDKREFHPIYLKVNAR